MKPKPALIDPALAAAGWGLVPGSRIARESHITHGRLQGAGVRAKPEIADYVLIFRDRRLAVVDAKKRDAPLTEGLAQAKRYATKLQVPFAYATNGDGIYRVDMVSGDEGEVTDYPTPDALWAAAFGDEEEIAAHWRRRFAEVVFEDKSGQWQPRDYQHNAITAVMEGIAHGRDRLLLTLATGTGKTAIAFQIAWKLFHSRWNLGDWQSTDEPARRPRILFLAGRNILANQAFNAFSAFPEDALVRIDRRSFARRAACPRTAASSSPFFRPS